MSRKPGRKSQSWKDSASVVLVGGTPHGVCQHCTPAVNLTHTTGQHHQWSVLKDAFRPSAYSVLGRARKAIYGNLEVPSLDTSSLKEVPSDADGGSPKVTLSVSTLRSRLARHETHSDDLYAPKNVEFALDFLNLN